MSQPSKLQSVIDTIRVVLDKAQVALTGEPARFIAYGGAAVVVLVVLVANALGFTRFGANIDFGTALALTTTALATLVGLIETIRHYVYSPNTVQVIAAQSAATGVPVVPPPPASDVADGDGAAQAGQ